MRRSYAERVQAGQRLAAHNAQPVHFICVHRDATNRPIRILDYGTVTLTKARSLANKLDTPTMNTTWMSEESFQAGMNGEKGYKTWGVPIVTVRKYNPATGLPEDTAVKAENFKTGLTTDQHGYTKLEAYWPSKPSWRQYGTGRAHLEATLQRGGSIWLVLSEVPDEGNATRTVMVQLPPEVVTDLKLLTESKQP